MTVNRRIVIGAIAALTGLAVVWLTVVYVLGRDRDAAERELSEERLQVLTSAARTFATSLDGIGKDLALAAALRDESRLGSPRGELLAMLAIKQQYVVIEIRPEQGESISVANGVGGPVLALARPVIDNMIVTARRAPGELHVSPGLSSSDDLPAWYRVFAIRPRDRADTVACLIDMRLLVAPPDVVRIGPSKLLVMSAHGVPAPASDPDIARALHAEANHGVLHQMLDSARGRHAMTARLEAETARSVGLPPAPAIAAAVPVEIDAGTPWVLLLVTSTQSLDARHAAVVRRLAIDIAIGALLVFVAGMYIVRNARRAGVLREKLRHAELLAHLTEKAEKILDHVPSGVLALDESDHVSARNRWFGSRDIVGRPLLEVFSEAPAEVQRVVADLVASARRDRRPRSLRRTRLALFGADAYVALHAIPLENVFRDVATLLVIDDESDLQRAEDRLLRSEKLATAGQLAAGIAHEVGSPLGVARGRAEMILLRGQTDEDDSKNLRTIVDRIDHVSRLITQLLDYLRPQPSQMQAVDAAHSLRVVAELLEPHARSHEVTLDVCGGEGAARLRADPGQLQQVLVNLVMNAIDACDHGGRVTLSARASADDVVLEVADNGHGIDSHDRAHIFDPFFTTKKRGQGTGLGLWVVAQVARAHDAEIELDTTRGTGTTVRIVWPSLERAA